MGREGGGHRHRLRHERLVDDGCAGGRPGPGLQRHARCADLDALRLGRAARRLACMGRHAARDLAPAGDRAAPRPRPPRRPGARLGASDAPVGRHHRHRPERDRRGGGRRARAGRARHGRRPPGRRGIGSLGGARLRRPVRRLVPRRDAPRHPRSSRSVRHPKTRTCPPRRSQGSASRSSTDSPRARAASPARGRPRTPRAWPRRTPSSGAACGSCCRMARVRRSCPRRRCRSTIPGPRPWRSILRPRRPGGRAACSA